MTGWGVEVNEVAIFANRLGLDWWVEQVGRMQLSGRAVPLALSPGGGVWWIRCDDEEEADFVRGHIVSHGVHAKSVKVRRSPSRPLPEQVA